MLQLDLVSTNRSLRTFTLGVLATGVVQLLFPQAADAHFRLDAPASWMSQTANGDPQKTGPCGNEAGGTATGTVTRITPQPDGTSRVTIMWHDTVPHPGHYRIALAVNSRSELPPEPVVTPTTADACASAAVATAPYSLPILADNVNPHTSSALQGNQMLTVTIPASVSCTHCTLQVLEFMSSHGAPCFYHHCADLAIGAIGGAGGVSGAGGGAGRAGGTGGSSTGTGGRGPGGSGGATGTGGVTGSGGLTPDAGVVAGTGGAATTTGGSTATGGAVASTGGVSASGGTSSSGGTTAPGTGGQPAPDGSTTGVPADAGCGCALAGSGSQSLGLGLGSLVALIGLCLTRRRRRGDN